jgi:ribosomal protein S18 acetylase RimI-like enzyme
MTHRNAGTAEKELGAVRVRAARDADLPSVIALDAENTGVAKASYWKERFGWYAGGKPDRFFLVAERDRDVVGFIVGEVRAWEFGSPPSGWIFAVHVSPSARLGGLGTLLFEEICARFEKAGVEQVRTMVAKDAHLLLSFFRSQGLRGGPFIQLEKRLGR